MFDLDHCSNLLPCLSTFPLALWYILQTVEKMIFLKLTSVCVMLLLAQSPSGSCCCPYVKYEMLYCIPSNSTCSVLPSLSSFTLCSAPPVSSAVSPITHHHYHFFLSQSVGYAPPLPPPPQELVLSTTYFTASFPNLPCSQPPSRMLVSRGQGISPSVAALRLFVWLVTSSSCLFTSSIRTRCVSHSFTSASPPPVLIIAR